MQEITGEELVILQPGGNGFPTIRTRGFYCREAEKAEGQSRFNTEAQRRHRAAQRDLM
jgi:hypothetical protein